MWPRARSSIRHVERGGESLRRPPATQPTGRASSNGARRGYRFIGTVIGDKKGPAADPRRGVARRRLMRRARVALAMAQPSPVRFLDQATLTPSDASHALPVFRAGTLPKFSPDGNQSSLPGTGKRDNQDFTSGRRAAVLAFDDPSCGRPKPMARDGRHMRLSASRGGRGLF